MLILSRKPNESILIGENIRITVAGIRGRYVRIGIEAPGDVGIYREELRSGPATDTAPAPRDIHDRVRAGHKLRSVARVGTSKNDGAIAGDV